MRHGTSTLSIKCISSKHQYERAMLNMGITVVAYQSNNGVFTAAAFSKEILERQHAIAFSGVGAHHQ
jgi:hypothetical protein